MMEYAINIHEDEEQMCLFRWAAYQRAAVPELGLLLHIPNGGWRGKAEAGRFKAMGVRPGVPDIFLPVARGGKHGLWIELKRRRGGHVSPDQQRWIEDLQRQGYAAQVCYGWDEAREAIKEYLGASLTGRMLED